MKTESYELAYIDVKDGALRIDTGHISRQSECFYENVTIEYHDDCIVVHGYRRSSKFHSDWDEDHFMSIDIEFASNFCTNEGDFYELKSRWPYIKPKRRLKQGNYLYKEATEQLICSSNFIIAHHS